MVGRSHTLRMSANMSQSSESRSTSLCSCLGRRWECLMLQRCPLGPVHLTAEQRLVRSRRDRPLLEAGSCANTPARASIPARTLSENGTSGGALCHPRLITAQTACPSCCDQIAPISSHWTLRPATSTQDCSFLWAPSAIFAPRFHRTTQSGDVAPSDLRVRRTSPSIAHTSLADPHLTGGASSRLSRTQRVASAPRCDPAVDAMY